jgi:predicted RNA-binding protein with PUA-like domain
LLILVWNLKIGKTMNYWLIKTEPGNYSWEDLKKDKQTYWDGVRNYQARNNLKAMKEGDLCLYYHSVNQKCALGVAKVIREFYQDPTTEDERWVAVDVAPDFDFKHPVTLAMVKATPELSDMVLVKNSRLSVQPVLLAEFDKIVAMGMEG